MTQPEEFDLVILGGGTGSTVAAWTFAGEGNRVAVVDRKYIGGSCSNFACLPSKNIIHSAKVASYFRRSKEFGITHDVSRFICRASVTGSAGWYPAWTTCTLENYRKTGAEFILGTGRFIAPRTGFSASSAALADVKALYRGWGIVCAGTQVYAARSSEEWLSKIPQAGVRRRAELLYQQLDGLQALRREVRPELLAESRKHKAAKLRRQIPCIGPIRAARLIALMQTPRRFRSKRQLWEHNRDFATAEMEHRQNAERCRQDGANVEHRTDLQSASGPLSSRPILTLFVRLSHP
jgi:hypothetical protein